MQAVRAGHSPAAALANCPPPARPGAQALAFHALRQLGAATVLRTALVAKTPPPKVDALLLTALALLWPEGRPPYAEHTLVDQAVAAMRRRAAPSAAFLNAVLRRFLRERAALVAAALADPLARYNHPRWWVERLAADWPEQWRGLLVEANRHPPMTLRVNRRRGSVAAYLDRLTAAGIAAEAIGGAAIRLARACPVDALPGFADGEVSVQDAAAQRAAPLLLGIGIGIGIGVGIRIGAVFGFDVAAARGTAADTVDAALSRAWIASRGARPRVLDACAAPGGKTAHLLELADLDLLAIDSDPARLPRVGQTLARLGLAATMQVADAADPARWWDGRPFDAILLDAPCSASGIVRRHPDVRWLRRESDVAALVATQSRLLDALWPLLAPGGRLLYATCSVFRDEGERGIVAFLQRRPDADLAADPTSPGHLLPLPDNPEGPTPGPLLASDEDGFFYALIEKTH